MAGNRWTREQDLAVLYLRHRGVRRRDPEIGDLARAMNRTEAAIWMRKGNFDSLDPLVPGVGLGGVSNLTRSVWEGYLEDPERILAEARSAFLSLLGADAPSATAKARTTSLPTRATVSEAEAIVSEADEYEMGGGGRSYITVLLVLAIIIVVVGSIWASVTDDSDPSQVKTYTYRPYRGPSGELFAQALYPRRL